MNKFISIVCRPGAGMARFGGGFSQVWTSHFLVVFSHGKERDFSYGLFIRALVPSAGLHLMTQPSYNFIHRFYLTK